MNLSKSSLDDLTGLVESKKAKVGIFGAGYVGLPLACAFAEFGFRTIACDTDVDKILAITNGQSYIEDDHVGQSLGRLVKSGFLGAQDDIAAGTEASDFLIVTVPTPLDATGEPDLSYVKGVVEVISKKTRGPFRHLGELRIPGYNRGNRQTNS